MAYISFDDFSETALVKEREECFHAGANGEKLAERITNMKESHGKNAASLRHTVSLFSDIEPKKRLHTTITARFEQERKWTKHYDACIAEHKKGQQVYKLKIELDNAKKLAVKKEAEHRAMLATKIEETRKQCRVQHFAEFEAQVKANKEALKKEAKEKAANKPSFFSWLGTKLGFKKEAKKDKPKPAPMVTKQAVHSNSLDNKKREFYQQNPEERKKRLEELRKKIADKAAA